MNSFGAALIALGAGVLLAGAATVESVAADSPTVSPITVAKPVSTTPQATNFGALDYFQTSCARCHGNYGAAYGNTFGKNLNDTQMHDVVRDMAAGPAQAPLDEKDLASLVAWHCALRDGKPFVSVVKAEPAGKGWQLSGEVSPGATLQIKGVEVKHEGHSWTAMVTSDGPTQIQAKLGDQTTTLNAFKSAYAP